VGPDPAARTLARGATGTVGILITYSLRSQQRRLAHARPAAHHQRPALTRAHRRERTRTDIRTRLDGRSFFMILWW